MTATGHAPTSGEDQGLPDTPSSGARRTIVVALAAAVIAAVAVFVLTRSDNSTPDSALDPTATGSEDGAAWSSQLVADRIRADASTEGRALTATEQNLVDYWEWLGPHCSTQVGSGAVSVSGLCQVDLLPEEWTAILATAPDPTLDGLTFPRWWPGDDTERQLLLAANGRLNPSLERFVYYACRDSIAAGEPLAGECSELPAEVLADLQPTS